MMNKTAQRLLVVFSTLLLLVSVTVSAHAQHPTPFTGTWNTVTEKGEKFVISLRERSPNLADGSYYSLPGMTGSQPVLQTVGRIKGTVDGMVLRFTWRQEDGSQGAGRFTLSSDGESFEGTFSTTKNPDDTSGGTWNGTREHSFAGAWQGKFGGSLLTMIFQQAGNRVTGQLNANSADFGVIRDGIVADNTLRFTIVRPGRVLFNGSISPDEYVGIGELVLDAGGKSFTGHVLGTVTNGGTLIAR